MAGLVRLLVRRSATPGSAGAPLVDESATRADQRGSVLDAELAKKRGYVAFDGAFGDAEPSGNLPIRPQSRHQA